MRSMMCCATQSSQSSAPVSFALTSSFRSLPTVSTRDQGILTGSLLLGPQSLPSRFERRPRAGWMRIHNVGPPMRMGVTRGCVFSPACITSPLTRPMQHSSRSISFLSRTSRTRSISAPNDLQRDRYQRQNERNHDNDRHDGIADPAVTIFSEVDRIVHQEQKGHDSERKRSARKRHRQHRNLDWIDAQYEWNRGEQDDEGVDEGEPRVLRGLEVLTPVPAEPLREEVCNRQRNLERGAEAREQH